MVIVMQVGLSAHGVPDSGGSMSTGGGGMNGTSPSGTSGSCCAWGGWLYACIRGLAYIHIVTIE